jgi:hypothetical protein
MSVIYIGFGNSDDKLGQREWALFQIQLGDVLRNRNANVIGYWHSYPESMYQNACYAVQVDPDLVPELKGDLAALATEFRQDSIAWAEAPTTEFLGAK